jgi:hypothetical protein
LQAFLTFSALTCFPAIRSKLAPISRYLRKNVMLNVVSTKIKLKIRIWFKKRLDPSLLHAGIRDSDSGNGLSGGYSLSSHGILYSGGSLALDLGSGRPGVAPVMAVTAGAFL